MAFLMSNIYRSYLPLSKHYADEEVVVAKFICVHTNGTRG